jgi:hypothetical protein
MKATRSEAWQNQHEITLITDPALIHPNGRPPKDEILEPLSSRSCRKYAPEALRVKTSCHLNELQKNGIM